MRRNQVVRYSFETGGAEPIALQVPLNDAPVVAPVIDEDPDAFDADDCSIYADPVEQPIDLITQEHCLLSPDGTHSYLRRDPRCCYCGTPHPSIRANACGQL